MNQRGAGHEVLHDGAQDGGLELLPFAVGLGDGDEVGAEEDAGHALDPEQALGQRRLGGGVLVAQVERAGGEHRPSGQEFEGGRVGGRLGLDEHGWLLRRRGLRDRAAGSFADI
jgi:hypothetical protein